MNNTKVCYLDANVLVYLKDVTSKQHSKCVSLIKKLIIEKYNFCVSPLGIDEFLYVVYSSLRRVGSKTVIDALRNSLKSILSLPILTVVNPPIDKASQVKVISYMEKFLLKPRDAYHLLIMKSHKIKYFFTFDSDFNKVFEAKVVKGVR